MREYTTTREPSLIREMNVGDHFILDAINDGFPLSTVVSTDNFLKTDASVYNLSVLLSPAPETPAVWERLSDLAAKGRQVIVYGTPERLAMLSPLPGMLLVDATAEPSALREALAACGYEITFRKKVEGKPPTLAISRARNALMFSVYSANTTTAAAFRFPLGAPILCGAECEMENGASVYRFSRGELRECRVFVSQDGGVISCREAAPVNARFRRSIHIAGLSGATVRLFPEPGCECAVTLGRGADHKPVYDKRFRLVHDELLGDYLLGEQVDGDIYFRIGHKGTR